MSFVFPGIKAFMIMGIAEIVAGALILLGLLRTKKGFIARLLGGITLIAFGIFFVAMRSVGEIHIDEGRRAFYIETSLGFDAIVGAYDFEAFEAAFRGHVYVP